MKNAIIDKIEDEQTKKNLPSVKVGDLVKVYKTIQEGKKQRKQRFEGTIIKMKGSKSRKNITIRKIIGNVGVEKTFLLSSPLLASIEVLKRSKVRRAKLYYLRGRVGAKANRLKSLN